MKGKIMNFLHCVEEFFIFSVFIKAPAKEGASGQIPKKGGGQNLEWWNVELPVFRNFETANIKIKKD